MTTLLAVYDGGGVLQQRFEYAAGRLPVRMVEGGAAYHLVYDQVGTLRAVVDGSGNVVKTVEYDSFGNVVADSDASFAIPFGFAGGLYDGDTELVRFGFRDYDADVGRWTAKDPIQFAGGDTDLYGYCLGDPVGLVDVDGLDVEVIYESASTWGINHNHLALRINDFVYSFRGEGDTAFLDVIPKLYYYNVHIKFDRRWAKGCKLDLSQNEESIIQSFYNGLIANALDKIVDDEVISYELPFDFDSWHQNCSTVVKAAIMAAKGEIISKGDIFPWNWPGIVYDYIKSRDDIHYNEYDIKESILK